MSHLTMSQFASRLDFEAAQAAHNRKKLVRYSALHYILIGGRATVVPVDHPDTSYVTNGMAATTSEVLWHNEETGVFETLNTRYVPQSLVSP